MRIGSLDKRIVLQSPVNTPDGMGGVTLTWVDEKKVWAAVWPVSAVEVIRAEAPTMTITHRIRIRYYSGLDPSWRIQFGDRYFTIVSIVNRNEKNVLQDILSKEAA